MFLGSWTTRIVAVREDRAIADKLTYRVRLDADVRTRNQMLGDKLVRTHPSSQHAPLLSVPEMRPYGRLGGR